jgi:transglycosylase-like protein with SLT domain
MRPGTRYSATIIRVAPALAPAFSLGRPDLPYRRPNQPSCFRLYSTALTPHQPGGNIKKQPFAQLLLLAAGALVTVILTLPLVHPVFVRQAPVVDAILEHGYVDTDVRAPWLSAPVDVALRTPEFLADRERFMRDLLRTGKVNEERAWSLADVAVSEAYRRRLPPALVLGVMLTENDELKSSARSRVGAIGLMQVHGRSWRSALGRMFGTNLRNDTTNLRYGVYILSYMARRASEKTAADSTSDTPTASDSSWRMALLHYNGCVRGTNTRDCQSYPIAVQRNVIDNAKSTCNGRDFEACVAKPLWLSTRSEH